jgi:hypothetical protein
LKQKLQVKIDVNLSLLQVSKLLEFLLQLQILLLGKPKQNQLENSLQVIFQVLILTLLFVDLFHLNNVLPFLLTQKVNIGHLFVLLIGNSLDICDASLLRQFVLDNVQLVHKSLSLQRLYLLKVHHEL